jgi:hypothetical protein
MRIPIAIPPSRKQPVARLLTVAEYTAKEPISVEPIVPQVVEEVKQPELPSKFEMAKNITKSALAVAKGILQGQPIKETTSESQRRLEICGRCEFFRKADQRCSKCGCYMAVKTYLKASRCPLPVPRW